MLRAINKFMINKNYKDEVIALLKQAIDKDLVKPNIDLSLIQEVYCILKPKATKIYTWYIRYNNQLFELPKARSTKSHEKIFICDFYCNRCGKYIGQFDIFSFCLDELYVEPIPFNKWYGFKPLRKLCKHCFRSEVTFSGQDKKKKTCLERYGTEYPTQCKEIKKKIHTTRKNNTELNPLKYRNAANNFSVYKLQNGNLEYTCSPYTGEESLKRSFDKLQNKKFSSPNLIEAFIKHVQTAIDANYIACNIEDLKLINGLYYILENNSSQKNVVNWYAVYNNQIFNLKKRNSRLSIPCKQYCRSCGKFLLDIDDLFKITLSSLSIDFIPINIAKGGCGRYCKSCAGHHNSIVGQAKAIKTNQERYGVDYPTQAQIIKDKTNKTIEEKYGGRDSQKWKSLFKTSGYVLYNGQLVHNGSIPEIRKQMVLTWKKTLDEMPYEKRHEWIQKSISRNKSRIEDEFFNLLEQQYNYKIERQYRIKRFVVDGIYNNIVIEFYGDYYHANPKIYKETDLLRFHNKIKKVADLHNFDKERLNFIREQTNKQIIVVWEKTFNQDKRATIDIVAKLLKELEKKNGKRIYYI